MIADSMGNFAAEQELQATPCRQCARGLRTVSLSSSGPVSLHSLTFKLHASALLKKLLLCGVDGARDPGSLHRRRRVWALTAPRFDTTLRSDRTAGGGERNRGKMRFIPHAIASGS